MKSIKNKLTIATYTEGYSVKYIDCMDIAYAGATGSYSEDNYYKYCFLQSVYSNWSSHRDHSNIARQVLGEIGLVENRIEVSNFSDLLDILSDKLGESIPCILLVRDRCCFYCEQYLEDHNALHFILVSGIDTNKSIVEIREYMHIRNSIAPLCHSDMLCPLNITFNMLKNIWEESNKTFYEHILITIEPIHRNVDSRKSVEILIDSISKNENRLIGLIEQYNMSSKEIKEMMEERTTYIGSLTVIFDEIEKENNLGNNTNFLHFKEEYTKHRDKTIAKLHASKMRNKPLGEDVVSSLCNEVKKYDKLLLEWMRKISENTY